MFSDQFFVFCPVYKNIGEIYPFYILFDNLKSALFCVANTSTGSFVQSKICNFHEDTRFWKAEFVWSINWKKKIITTIIWIYREKRAFAKKKIISQPKPIQKKFSKKKRLVEKYCIKNTKEIEIQREKKKYRIKMMLKKSGLNWCICIIVLATSGLCAARSGLYSEESPSSVRIEQCHEGCIKKVTKYDRKTKILLKIKISTTNYTCSRFVC